MEPKPYWKSWTIWTSLALTVAGAVEQFVPTIQLPPDVQGYVLIVIGAVVAALRIKTNQPVK